MHKIFKYILPPYCWKKKNIHYTKAQHSLDLQSLFYFSGKQILQQAGSSQYIPTSLNGESTTLFIAEAGPRGRNLHWRRGRQLERRVNLQFELSENREVGTTSQEACHLSNLLPANPFIEAHLIQGVNHQERHNPQALMNS